MVDVEPLMVEGDGREGGGFGDGVGRVLWVVVCCDAVVPCFRDGHVQSIWRRLQEPQVGRCSSHFTRRALHFTHPFLLLRCPTFAGRPLVSESTMAAVTGGSKVRECGVSAGQCSSGVPRLMGMS